MTNAIVVHNLGKRFHRYHAEKPATLMEAALKGWQRLRPIEAFWALRYINFTVAAGEMLGVIGHNGAGKSTLLQLLGGVGRPNEGRVRVAGRIGALLDLGSGLHGDLTGRENIFVTAIVAGLTRREVARRFDQIVAFAELEPFIDNPVRTYSSGMQMRLAFSVAVHTNPDVLLVDEFLSVGDLAFQSKCLNRIAELKQNGCAIVLISHDASQVERLCDRALWLKHGQVAAYGEPQVVAGQYVSEMHSQTLQRTPNRPPQFTRSGQELRVNENRFGSLEIEITDVQLLPSEIASGAPLCIEIEYFASAPIESPIFSISISREDGQVCFNTNTLMQGLTVPVIQGNGKISLYLDRLDLAGGDYFVDVGIHEKEWTYTYDYHWHVYPLWINSQNPDHGLLHPPHHWKMEHTSIPNLSDRYRSLK
jgi:lipopolysaccharide transport system ATP-binding protein